MEKNIKVLKFFKEWIVFIIVVIGIVFFINKFLVYNVYILSELMVLILNVGDKLMVIRVYDINKIKRGDIIVFFFKELNEMLIKRVIGLLGDYIEIINGVVNINGEDIKEDYVKNNEYNDKKLVFDVFENKFFFLGDNRICLNDVRRWINLYIDVLDINVKVRIKIYLFKDFGILY